MKAFRADDPTLSFDTLSDAHTDVTGAELVDVQVNKVRGTLHVNVNGICLLRICEIKNLHVGVIEHSKPLGEYACPNCGGEHVDQIITADDQFEGADVPVRVCRDCHASWEDEDTFAARRLTAAARGIST